MDSHGKLLSLSLPGNTFSIILSFSFIIIFPFQYYSLFYFFIFHFHFYYYYIYFLNFFFDLVTQPKLPSSFASEYKLVIFQVLASMSHEYDSVSIILHRPLPSLVHLLFHFYF